MSPSPAQTAIDWIVRQRDPGFADWEELTSWLEAHPAHGEAYRNLLALDAAVAEDMAHCPPADLGAATEYALPQRRWRLAPLMAAAAVLALVVIPGFVATRSDEAVIASGARRHLSLEDGSLIVLNDGARIRIDRSEPRRVTIEKGEALFQVAHDPTRRFRVSFDGGHVENLGTRFIVSRSGSRTEIAVAEGAVGYRGDAGTAELHPGERLRAEGAAKRVDRVDPLTVGSWATPRLVYEAVPLHIVATDLSRELGVPVTVAPAVADKAVTASISLELDRDRNLTRLSSLLDLPIRREGGGWRIEPRE